MREMQDVEKWTKIFTGKIVNAKDVKRFECSALIEATYISEYIHFNNSSMNK